MGRIIHMLADQRYARLPELFEGQPLKSGIMLEFTIESEASFEALKWLADRYLDADVIWRNRIRDHSKDDIGEDDLEAFPYTYQIDASAILLAFAIDNDRGLCALGSELLWQLKELYIQAANMEGSVFDLISLEEGQDPRPGDEQEYMG